MKIAILPGNGIGPEIMQQAVKVLNALRSNGLRFEAHEASLRGERIEALGTTMPFATHALVKEADAILFGAIGASSTAVSEEPDLLAPVRPKSALLEMRRDLGLYANIRPVKYIPELGNASPLRADLAAQLDLVVVRELNADIYFGEPRGVTGKLGARTGINTMRYEEHEIERIAHAAFRLARQRRRKLCSVDKANVLETMALWRDVVTRIGRDYPEVELSHLYVDAAAMMLLRDPGRFDVIVTGNLFGDILSDQTAMMMGSIGLSPSASLGEGGKGLYEPIHGSAPDIAGKDIANPLGMILSAAMMLRHSFGDEVAAARVEKAVRKVLAGGLRTADVMNEGGRLVGCEAMGDAVAAEI
jgi:3-isopropylmalate dehydrogenase